jgi:hypothetical protein
MKVIELYYHVKTRTWMGQNVTFLDEDASTDRQGKGAWGVRSEEGEQRINPLQAPPHHNPATTHFSLPSSIWSLLFPLK